MLRCAVSIVLLLRRSRERLELWHDVMKLYTASNFSRNHDIDTFFRDVMKLNSSLLSRFYTSKTHFTE